jgi:hypothetical protein
MSIAKIAPLHTHLHFSSAVLYWHNARQTQPLYDRVVLESR